MSNAISQYAVIGNPIAHSKSPEIHAGFAAQTGQAMQYDKLLAPLDGFAHCVRAFMAAGACGANVTVPFKLEAHALADSLSERARAAGAVNTLSFVDGKIIGDNTDGIGLVADIVKNAGISMGGKRVLLLGAGGAARGVMLQLIAQAPIELVIVNRTAATAVALTQQFASAAESAAIRVIACGFADLRGAFDIVINATSASLHQELPPIPSFVFRSGSLAYDMMYGNQATNFMRFAVEQGADARDGLGMLVEQAAEAFFIWRGVHPDTAPVFAKLRGQF